MSIIIGGVGLEFIHPKLKQISETIFNYEGGSKAIPELLALVVALAMYTSTFIAECVRAGIEGVTKGQKEAAASIGLTPGQILRLVVMPQALRIIIPPTTNQYSKFNKKFFFSGGNSVSRYCACFCRYCFNANRKSY